MEKVKEFFRKNKKIVIGVGAFLVVAIVVSLIANFTTSNTSSKIDPKETDAFFIKNKDDKYALFNEKGKQLTDFKYTQANTMFNGVAKVKDTDDKVAVLNDKGKYVIKPGKYETITQYGGVFKINEKDLIYSLMNKSGKKITSVIDVQSGITVEGFVIAATKKGYVLYNYNGKEIYTFKIKDDDSKIPTINEMGDYGSAYYEGMTVIFNVKTASVIAKIKEDRHYCVNNYTEDEKTISLNSCVSIFDSEKDTKYKVIINKKVKDLSSECDKVYLTNDQLTCNVDNKAYLLDNKLKKTNVELSDISYMDYKNYAKRNKDNDIEFVKNGKVIGKLESANLSDKGYTKDGIYLIYKDSKYVYYNYEGKKLFDKSYKRAAAFDENGLAKVSEDGEKYYLINNKGKKVSDEFESIYRYGEYYSVTLDGKKSVMSTNGKLLTELKYDSVDVKLHNDDAYIYVSTNKKYEVISAKTKKAILSSNDKISFYDHYLKVDKIYYTYAGKEFYKEA